MEQPVRALGSARHSQYREVIRLRAAAGENQFRGGAADQAAHLPPGLLQPLFSRLPEMVDAGRVTIHLTETQHHGLQHCGGDRGSRVVVEVETLHCFLTF